MKQKIRTASLLLLMVLGIGLVLMACGSKSLADSRTVGSDSYGLNVESMTGTDSYQMGLQEGEVLAVHFETVRGSMCMEIQAPDESPLYQGNGKGVTEFTVNTPFSWRRIAPKESFTFSRKWRNKMHVDQILAEWIAPLWAQLRMNGSTALLMLIALYYTVKWAVKNGVKEAFQEMKEMEETT